MARLLAILSLVLVVLAVTAVRALPRDARGAGTLQRVVGVGDTAPTGGKFTDINYLTLGGDGSVAFQGCADSCDHSTLFVYSGADQRVSVTTGDPAPTGGTLDGNVCSGGHPEFFSVGRSRDGTFVFQSMVNRVPTVTSCSYDRLGVYEANESALSVVAETGDVTSGGVTLARAYNPAIAPNGLVAFVGCSSICSDPALYLSPSTRLLRVGDSLWPGATVAGAPAPVGVDDSGGVFAIASVTESGTVHDCIVLVRVLGSTRVACVNDVLPGGEVLLQMPLVHVNVGDHAAFSTGHGVYVWRDSRVDKLATEGDPAPGGGTFGPFTTTAPISGGGDVLFTSYIRNIDGTGRYVVFVSSAGTTAPAFTSGVDLPDPCPLTGQDINNNHQVLLGLECTAAAVYYIGTYNSPSALSASWIAFRVGDGPAPGLYFERPDGAERQLVASGDIYDPRWSPDGTKIAYWDRNDSMVKVIDVVTHTVRSLACAAGSSNEGHGFEFGPSEEWSYDSKKLAYTDCIGNLVVIDASNGATTTIGSSSAWERFPGWDPTGDRLAFACGALGNDVCLSDSQGNHLGTISFSSSTQVLPSPRFSPDGKRLLVPRNTGGVGFFKLVVVNTDGTNRRDLTDPNADFSTVLASVPVWSPDGRHIAFSTSESSGRVLDVDSGAPPTAPSQVELGGRVGLQPWSPDGGRLVTMRPDFPTYVGDDLYIVKSDATNEAPIAVTAQTEGAAAWGPAIAQPPTPTPTPTRTDTATPTPTATPRPTLRYTATGDSIPSGVDLGASCSNSAPPCVSAPNHAYPSKLADRLTPSLVRNIACSGAGSDAYLTTDSCKRSQLTQALSRDFDLLTITVGADDGILNGFVPCLHKLPDSRAAAQCANSLENSSTLWSGLATRLDSILGRYKAYLNTHPKSVVVETDYYNPVPKPASGAQWDIARGAACRAYAVQATKRLAGSKFSQAESQCETFLNDLNGLFASAGRIVDKLNKTIQDAVSRAATDQIRFVSVHSAFDGHCSPILVDARVNTTWFAIGNFGCSEASSWIAATQREESQAHGFRVAITVGVHPSDVGQQCIANLIWNATKGNFGYSGVADAKCG